MKVDLKDPPRSFKQGKDYEVTLKDCGTVSLDPDEQITFISDDGKEYDIVRKDWGYYGTPSVNGRLKKFGFKTALVKNENEMIYVMIVEKDKIEQFNKYISKSKQEVIQWLDEI